LRMRIRELVLGSSEAGSRGLCRPCETPPDIEDL
jgi:hypothetical protein